MPPVFISYRQCNASQRNLVRSFADKIRKCGIPVVLDQFYLDSNPGGPPEGWPKWSGDRATETNRVIIIGNDPWFRCFDGKEEFGTGLGAACEALVLRQRLYRDSGFNQNIRIVLFDPGDAMFIPRILECYHRFHADQDFAKIIEWLGGAIPSAIEADASFPRTSTPNCLNHLSHFFGRERELSLIATALSPDTRTWGVFIDGPGGIGKTSLAHRAAELIPDGLFSRILFLSAKKFEMTSDGKRKLTDFVLPGYPEMLNDIARQLQLQDFQTFPEAERARRLLEKLGSQRVLLIIDDLESIPQEQRELLLTFLSRLPQGCKAIATSRRHYDVDARLLRLDKLDQDAALLFLDELARERPLLAKASLSERLHLYEETGGNPLLLRWIAGQLGRGWCTTIAHALELLRSAPPDNDPLEFIFGNLLETFTDNETRVLAALSCFNASVKTKVLAELSGISMAAARAALLDLSNRSLVVPDEEEESFTLVRMVADFLRRMRPEVIRQTNLRLVDRAAWIITVNGWQKLERFPELDREWPTLSPALPLLIDGPDERLQRICAALSRYIQSRGHLDEWLSLCTQAEKHAVEAGNYKEAGWRAYQAGYVHFQRRQVVELQECIDHVASHWGRPDTPLREQAASYRLRGLLHRLKGEFPQAIDAFEKALAMDRQVKPESRDMEKDLSNLAKTYSSAGDSETAEIYRNERHRVAAAVEEAQESAIKAGEDAATARQHHDWPKAEHYSRQGLCLSTALDRKDLIASHSCHLAEALLHQGRKTEAIPHAQKAVMIYAKFGLPNLDKARKILRECEP